MYGEHQLHTAVNWKQSRFSNVCTNLVNHCPTWKEIYSSVAKIKHLLFPFCVQYSCWCWCVFSIFYVVIQFSSIQTNNQALPNNSVFYIAKTICILRKLFKNLMVLFFRIPNLYCQFVHLFIDCNSCLSRPLVFH